MFFILTFSCVKSNDDITTPPIETSTITDIDGNVYQTVKIGAQWWMAENLKTRKFNDGSSILLITDDSMWCHISSPGFCYFNNDSITYKNEYGALYNKYAVLTGKLAPIGWHVPTNAEYQTLIDYLGGISVAGGKMKEIGTIHWSSPNAGADNSSGFTGLPGGIREKWVGTFEAMNREFGYWWTGSDAGHVILYHYNSMVALSEMNYNGQYLKSGYSVRCVRN